MHNREKQLIGSISMARPQAGAVFQRARPVVRPRARLFCFPYAGGSAAIFNQWVSKIPADVELLAVQYPGRGARLREAPCLSIEQLVAEVEPGLSAYSDRPCAFFGHSMGAIVAFETARRLAARGAAGPRHLFISGRQAPGCRALKKPIHSLSDSEFVNAIADMNGTPRQVIENAELMQLLLPALRADFAAVERWKYLSGPPIDIPLTIFGGDADPGVPPEGLAAWSVVTTAPMDTHVLPGDHFFIHQQFPAILDIVSRALAIACPH